MKDSKYAGVTPKIPPVLVLPFRHAGISSPVNFYVRTALPTTDQVYDELLHARMDQMSRRYLRDLRRSAYVDIRG